LRSPSVVAPSALAARMVMAASASTSVRSMVTF